MKISNRARELFAEAQTLDSDMRAQFVVTACGADGALRDEVNSLLDASEQSEAYFEQLANNISLPALADDEPVLPPDKLVGQWRPLELLGRGGMGSVYLAERADQQFDQRGALKVLPFGINSEEARSRFLLERQILASLVHKNIARLLDGGVTEDGTPYFVMDYVDGQAIDAYCDEHQLNVEARLRLFIEVGEAVQYAHRNLVVHRDLKPSNVLVDATGAVRLVDFGIAKTLYPNDSNRQLTRTGISPMTSIYASPEMLRGESVSTLSDVYALGVLLYELLSGRHPYDLPGQASTPEIWQQVCEFDPVPPSSAATTAPANVPPADAERSLAVARLHQRLRGDLDTIVAKAMRKDPEQRYASVEQLLADIQRHLSGLPVLARPQSFLYRLRKFAARQKGVVAAGFVAVLFVFTVAYQSGQTAQEAARADREAHVASQVSDFLVSIFEVANPSEARGNTITAREMLDRGAAQIAAGEIDDPEVRARLMSTVAYVYERLALYSEAEELFDDAIEMQTRLLGEDHPETLRTAMRIGLLYRTQGRFEEAQKALSDSLERQRRVLGENHPETLEAMHDLAIAHAQQGDFATAVRLGEELVPRRAEALGAEHAATLKSTSNLAIFYKLQGHYDKAEAMYLEVFEVLQRTVDEDHPDIGAVMQNLADLYGDQARYSEAVPLYRQMIEKSRRFFGDEHPRTTRAMANFANTYQAMGEFDKAEALYVDVVAVQRVTLGDDHPETLNAMANLGGLYIRQEKFVPARELLDEAVTAYRETLGRGHYKTLDALTRLVSVNFEMGNEEEVRRLQAERVLQRGKLAEREGASAQDKITFAWILLTAEPRDLRDPETALRFAIAANTETDHSEARFVRALALAYAETGNRALAVQNQRQAIALLPEEALSMREEYLEILAQFESVPTGP